METWTVKVLSCGVSFCRILRRHSEVDFMDIKCHHSNLWPLKSYQIILESKRTFTPNFKKLSPRHSWDIMFLVPGAATADMTAWKWTRLLFSHKKQLNLSRLSFLNTWLWEAAESSGIIKLCCPLGSYILLQIARKENARVKNKFLDIELLILE